MCMLVSDVVLPCLRGVCAHFGSERTVSVLVLNSVSVVGSRVSVPIWVCGVCLLVLASDKCVCPSGSEDCVSLLVLRGVYSCVGSSGCIFMFFSEGGVFLLVLRGLCALVLGLRDACPCFVFRDVCLPM